MTTGIGVHDQNLEKQIEKHMGGCMAGFFNLFDRSPLSSKRLYPKRLPSPLPSSKDVDSASETLSSVASPALSREFPKPTPQPSPVVRSPARSPAAVVSTPEFKESLKSPWKFSREAPRLSLDSRAIVDAKGGLRPREIRINTSAATSAAGDDDRDNQRRSPSVVARLMGLERLPSSTSDDSEPEKKVELRRSASESRSRDYRFFDPPSFLSPNADVVGERKSDQLMVNRSLSGCNVGKINPKVKNHQSNQRRVMVEKKSYYDTADFFPPELKYQQQQQQHQAVTIYGEIERRLKMRGIDEPSKDLETLKHILEALQLKGLLHSSPATTGGVKPRQNVVTDRRFTQKEESPIVLMKPAVSPVNRRRGGGFSGEAALSPRRERPARSAVRSPGRGENRSSSPAVRRKGGPLSVETQRKVSETTTGRGMQSPVQSPRMNRRLDRTVNRSPRNRRSTAEFNLRDRERTVFEDEASTVSESSFSACSHTDNERWRVEEYREGRNLLERCDKLLNSIAEMTSLNSNSNSNSTELQQPSPVSVLDPSFYKEDESSPSPVKKRTIDFKDQVVLDLEDELWSPSSSQIFSKPDQDIDSSDDSDFSYVSEVIRASHYLPEDTDLFVLLEKQNSVRGGKDKSKASILQRKLIFDTINEILDRNRQLPPWKAVSLIANRGPTLDQIWTEFLKIRERGPSEDILEVICGVLKKDLAGDSINGWSDCHVEMSEAVLDIERMIFKDLIGETIRDLAALGGKGVGNQAAFRRKLVF